MVFLKSLLSDPKKKILLINSLLFFVFVSLNLINQYNQKNWEAIPDCYDYLAQSKIDFFSLNFFFPTKTFVAYPRAFTIPLIYKLAGSDPQTIILVQKIIYSLSVAFFTYASSSIFKKDKIKYVWLVCCYLIFANWHNLGWSQTLLSESLGLSFFILWLGSFILYENKKTNYISILHILFLIFLSFSRDNMPYFILAFYTSYLLLQLFLKEKKTFSLTVTIITVFIFIIHNKSVEIGERQRLPLINTIITRIIPKVNYTAWFVREGMPMADSLKKNFVNINPQDDSKIKVYDMYKDSTYKVFFSWLTTHGKSTYIKFMVTHLDYFFLIHENWGEMGNKLFSDNGYYTGKTIGYSVFISYITIIFNDGILLALLLPILFLLFRLRVTFLRFLFAVFVFAIMLLFNYNSDTFEVGRHMYLNYCIVELMGVTGILLLVDNSEKYNFIFKKNISLKSY